MLLEHLLAGAPETAGAACRRRDAELDGPLLDVEFHGGLGGAGVPLGVESFLGDAEERDIPAEDRQAAGPRKAVSCRTLLERHVPAFRPDMGLDGRFWGDGCLAMAWFRRRPPAEMLASRFLATFLGRA